LVQGCQPGPPIEYIYFYLNKPGRDPGKKGSCLNVSQQGGVMTKRKMGDITLYNDTGEAIRATVYRKVIDASTFAGKDEELGIAEVIDENGQHINVYGEDEDMEFEYHSGEKLYIYPPGDK